MMPHTPSPWSVAKGSWSDDGYAQYELHGITTLNRSDALLIESAPDLLKGCIALDELFALLLACDDLPPIIREIIHDTNHRRALARAAIAKATRP